MHSPERIVRRGLLGLGWAVSLVVLLCWAAGLPMPPPARAAGTTQPRLSTLDNGTVRLSIDLAMGGVITELARSGSSENIVNSYDLGREIQQSYYSGPHPFGHPNPIWKGWPWNPIGAGDSYGHRAQVVTSSNDGTTLYEKSIPMQWALDDVPGRCTFETWIRLSGAAAQVHCRLTNDRRDHTRYPAWGQELPALYTNGRFYRLFTYDGTAPFTGGPLDQIQNAGPPWAYWTASENWAALVNDEGWGVGIFHPGVTTFKGGFAGQPGAGGPSDPATGYLSPSRGEILDHNITYDYDYVLIVGTLDEIRAYATSNHQDSSRDFEFKSDRQHWYYYGATDGGWPIRGALRIQTRRRNAYLISPDLWWPAADVPEIDLTAAFQTGRKSAAVYWTTPDNPDFSDDRRAFFHVVPDGRLRTYRVELAGTWGYTGIITGIGVDLNPGGSAGGEVVLKRIAGPPPSAPQ